MMMIFCTLLGCVETRGVFRRRFINMLGVVVVKKNFGEVCWGGCVERIWVA
jgi:hypothetical protein